MQPLTQPANGHVVSHRECQDMHRAAIAVTALAALPRVGCVVLPLPPVGAQIGREEIGSLQPGVSTRADVHESLGEPSQWVTNRYEIFNVSKETAHVLVALPFYAGGVERVGAQDFRVLAEYGPGGVLQSLGWEGMVEDTDAPEGRSYISSAAPALERHTRPPRRRGSLRLTVE